MRAIDRNGEAIKAMPARLYLMSSPVENSGISSYSLFMDERVT